MAVKKENPFKHFDHLEPDSVPLSDEEREQWEKRHEGEYTSLEEVKKELVLNPIYLWHETKLCL
ncbi:hypothetical protein [Thermoflavimicrobium dichotomicum]|uniref:Uncharacterized protein n=1 Tax=Thermoflavimicrobium dichotomicum TaxID=46223 RepID=A0A1I3UX14_9BACL|nr:hypothetical protein [Thermoflavimicrobium dichotomicum]SFJ87263.1 hypothetical protein SAMN05421852_1297 [Thermoflavimicrobium dichotomicum]